MSRHHPSVDTKQGQRSHDQPSTYAQLGAQCAFRRKLRSHRRSTVRNRQPNRGSYSGGAAAGVNDRAGAAATKVHRSTLSCVDLLRALLRTYRRRDWLANTALIPGV